MIGKHKLNTYLISWFTLGMCAGIVFWFMGYAIWLLLSVMLIAILVRHAFLKQNVFYTVILFCGACFGVITLNVHDFLISHHAPNLDYGEMTLLGKIEDVRNNNKVVMKLYSAIDANGVVCPVNNYRVMLKSEIPLTEGQTISCIANIFALNKNESAYMRRMFFDRYIGFGKIISASGVSGQARSLRRIMMDRVKQKLSESECAIVTPILFGGGAGELSATCRQLGISHLFAISGLHFAIFAGIFFVLGRWVIGPLVCIFFRRIDIIIMGQAFSFIGIILYLFLANISWSVLRSAITSTILLFAIFFRQQMDAKHATMLALLCILCLSPHAILDIGMQLSFIATFTLLYSRGNMLTSTVFVFLTTLPYLLYSFGQASLQPFVANLICGTFFSVVLMPLLGLGVMTYFIPPVCFLISKAIYVFVFLINVCKQIMIVELLHRISVLAIIVWSLGIGSWILIASPFVTTLCCGLSFLLWFEKPRSQILLGYNRYDIGFYENRILWVTNPDSVQSKLWDDELKPKVIFPIDQFRINENQYQFYDVVIEMSKNKNRFVKAMRNNETIMSQWDLVSRRNAQRIGIYSD